MLEFRKNTSNLETTLNAAKFVDKTEAYLIESITQRLTDLFLARYGEEILAQIDRAVLTQNVTDNVATKLAEESERTVRGD